MNMSIRVLFVIGSLMAGFQVQATKITEPSVKAYRAFLSAECKTKAPDRLNPVLAAIIPAAVDTLVGSVVSSVKKSGEDSTKTIDFSDSGFFYQLPSTSDELRYTAKYGCMTLVIYDRKLDKDARDLTPEKVRQSLDSILSDLPNPPDGFSSKHVDFLSEFTFEHSPDDTAFRVNANVIYASRFLHARRSPKERNYLFTFEVRSPGTKPGEAKISVPLRLLSGVKKHTYYAPEALADMGISSPWIAYPAVSEAANAQLAEAKRLQNALESREQASKLEKECKDGLYSNPCLKAKFSLKNDADGNEPSNQVLQDLLELYKVQTTKATKLETEKDKKRNALEKANIALQESQAAVGGYVDQVNSHAEKLCEQRSLNNIRRCLGSSHEVGEDPTCVNPSISACSFEGGTGGAEFMEWHVAVTETRPGSEFMKNLGEILEASKDDIASAIKSEIDPATIEEDKSAEETERQVTVKLQDNLRIAKQSVQIKELELAAETDAAKKLQLEFDVINKKHEANEYARRLGVALPYPNAK